MPGGSCNCVIGQPVPRRWLSHERGSSESRERVLTLYLRSGPFLAGQNAGKGPLCGWPECGVDEYLTDLQEEQLWREQLSAGRTAMAAPEAEYLEEATAWDALAVPEKP